MRSPVEIVLDMPSIRERLTGGRMKDYQFQHGDTVRDLVTRFEGVITGRADYISGCNQYSVTTRLSGKKSGEHGEACKEIEGRWFDEDRLQLLEPERIVLPGYATPTKKTKKTKKKAAKTKRPRYRPGGPSHNEPPKG